MLTRFCLSLALFATMPAWSQVETSTTEVTTNSATTNSASEAPMKTPPPVSGSAYPITVGAETRSNYLYAGVILNTAYNDNVLAGTSTTPVSDISYSIRPTIMLDQTTLRLHDTLTYSPGFTFYRNTTSLNEADQVLALNFQYRLSPHITVSVQDSFRKSSNVFNQFDSLAGSSISGSAQSSLVPIVAPIADQLNNVANTELTYQFGRNDMIGASGTFTNLHYLDPNQVPGLSDSSSRGGALFYTHRLSTTRYFGATYQYSYFSGSSPSAQNPAQSETQTQTIFPFFTIYLNPSLSFSLSGGPQYYEDSVSSLPTSSSWKPAAMASMGWQGSRASFAASYSQLVSGGGGLLGTYYSHNASGSIRWQLARTWTIGPSSTYSINKNVNQAMSLSNPGGHMISGTVSAQHSIGGRLTLEVGYMHLHQSYASIAVISSAPDTNREYISFSYQFARPLGR
jgi:hypothetical protein